jgi:hypothetical protein
MSAEATMISIAGTNPVQMDINIQDTHTTPIYVRYRVFYANTDADPYADPESLTYTPFGPITNLPAGNISVGIGFRYTAPFSLPINSWYAFQVELYDSFDNFITGVSDDQAGNVYITTVNNPVCLVKGTNILTPYGYKQIETLKKGDIVSTESKSVVIKNIHSIRYESTTKESAPYTIYKNAFGPNCPPNDISVSGRHAIQLRPGFWEIPQEVAKVNKRIVQEKLGSSVTYYHIELPDYASDNLIANGQIVESLNTGKYKETYVFDEKEKAYRRIIKRNAGTNAISK